MLGNMTQLLKEICLRYDRKGKRAEKHLPTPGEPDKEKAATASVSGFVSSVCPASILPFLRGTSHQPISVHAVKRD